MSRKLTLAIASTLVLGFASAASAQDARFDPTPDHMLYYGPVQSAAPQARHKTREVSAHPIAIQQQGHPTDRTADHMFYYGPIQ